MRARTAIAVTGLAAAGAFAAADVTIASLGARLSQEAEGFQWFQSRK